MRVTHSRSQAAGCALACGLLLGLAACSKDHNPLGAAREQGPVPVSPGSITIGGPTSLERPGAIGHLTATATFADHSSRDVTAEAYWSSSQPDVATITSPGAVTARQYGIASITAAYQGHRADLSLRVAPAGACLLRGIVLSEGGPPLADASVEFSSGCGTVTATTDRNGAFWLPADGEVQIRVELDGYQPFVRTVMSSGDQWVGPFVLQAVQLPGSLSGDYKLTVTASPSCTLPPEVRQRRYDARIVDVRNNLFVELSGAVMVTWASTPGFTGTRHDSVVQFDVSDGLDDTYSFIERVGPGRDLYYSGTALGDVRDATIVAVFSGRLVLRGGVAVLAECEATDHLFELVRSNGQ
jgi:hypothetical protein